MQPLKPVQSTGLAITNPLVLYRALLATKHIDPDPSQHRLALHLQKLYHRLKDYSPQAEYGDRLKAISHAIATENEKRGEESEEEKPVAVRGHPLRNNPLFRHLFRKKEDRDTVALTRVLTSHEAAMGLNSPRGLLLHGEVGTGKSMLVDLLADSLPNPKKKRWHFNTFMLETLSRLEHLRQTRAAGQESEYSLLWLAKDMIEKSPILFLDEFQLPDRAAAKILSNLLTSFFQLGGVVIATSNRMPDELAKAAGVEFAPPPTKGGLVRNWLGLGTGNRARGDMFGGTSDYAGFLDVLKARCEIWDMEGGKDWRRREAEEDVLDRSTEELREEILQEGLQGLATLTPGNLSLGHEQRFHGKAQASAEASADDKPKKIALSPKKYILSSQESDESWKAIVRGAFPEGSFDSAKIPWESTTLRVYGRNVPVPQHHMGIAYWNFDELCGGFFGPADYITISSTFHTLILDHVPILTLLQKNEARRMITLLDALYEARCKLVIRASAGPDDLFFPETTQPALATADAMEGTDKNTGDQTYAETIAEIYQDQTSPFRPNVSSYVSESRSGYNPDEDADFNPPGAGNEIGRQVDFGATTSFTGEDERFAYKRARSRLWEMCGGRWHSRQEEGWWKPLPIEVRRWEKSASDGLGKSFDTSLPETFTVGDVKIGPSYELDKPAGLQKGEYEEMMRAEDEAKRKGEGWFGRLK